MTFATNTYFPSTKYIYMGSRRMVAKIGDGSAETPAKPDPRGKEPNTDYENLQFFFHSDHLGSTSYMTDLSGEVSQHVQYFPYGGVMTEERSSGTENAYLFNGKELDLETGLYYYGARYYQANTSVWLGVDQLAEKYPNMSPFTFTMNNPIMYLDPDGEEPTPAEAARMAAHVYGDKSNDILIGGWKVSNRDLGVKQENLNHTETGLKSQVYERSTDGVTEYTYATAGTEDGIDMKADFKTTSWLV